MNRAIYHTYVALPLGLILSGCAGPQRSEPSNRRASRPSAHAAAMAFEGSDENLAFRRREPRTVDVQHDITLDQISEHVKNTTAVLIDARTPEQFASGHVRGALNLPAGKTEVYIVKFRESVASDQLLIIYCASPSCGSSDMVYEYLASQGYSNMRVFKPGWQQLASAKGLR